LSGFHIAVIMKSMENNLHEYIRDLTLNDTKTPIQKYMKAGEEMGELAKALLPLENAQGSLHNIYPKIKILEETVDNILVQFSIAYGEGFSYSDIIDMMQKKCDKWGERQAAEGQVSSVIPFEIHVSVNPEASVEEFQKICRGLGVKPLVLELDRGNGNVRRDMMTSSIFRGNNVEAMAEMERISEGVSIFGITRQKIETVPWHPKAPRNSQISSGMPMGCYFEAHFSVEVPNINLQAFCDEWIATGTTDVSINDKKRGLEKTVVMLTKRSYKGTRENFKDMVEDTKSLLTLYNVLDVNTEFAMYDTNPDYDSRQD